MTNRRRAIIAAVLAFVYPGLGHVYLRAWLRAAAWFALALFTATIVVPPTVLEAMGSGSLDAIITASEQLPLEAAIALLIVRGLNIADAYLVATRPHLVGAEHDTPDTDTDRCPSCGKELDADLDFCPWCTTRLDTEEESDADGPAASFR